MGYWLPSRFRVLLTGVSAVVMMDLKSAILTLARQLRADRDNNRDTHSIFPLRSF